MRVGVKDYGKYYGGNGANTYFMRDEASAMLIDRIISLIRDTPMNINELAECLGEKRNKIAHLLDTATLLYGNIWEESRRVRGKEIIYYAAE